VQFDGTAFDGIHIMYTCKCDILKCDVPRLKCLHEAEAQVLTFPLRVIILNIAQTGALHRLCRMTNY